MQLSLHRHEFIDMTEGSTVSRVLRFALPLIFGNLFQQLYAFVDAAIVGRFVGVNAFAAIGSTSWIIWWINTIPRDFSNAFCIASSVRIGAKNREEFLHLGALSICFGAALAILVTGALFLFVDPLFSLLHVSETVYTDARTYFLILALSLPIALAFHTVCALLRAAGNGTITFTAMAVSTLVNIALDILFVAVFSWGVAGAAWATLLSQVVSLLIALFAAKRSGLFCFSRRHFAHNGKLFFEIVRLWLPLVLNSLIITVGGTITQTRVNSLGTHFTAGFEVGVKLFALFEAVILALQTGASVFIGQNLGANKPDRIQSGMRRIVLFALGFTVLTIAIVWCFGEGMVTWFLSAEDPALFDAAKTVARRYARVLSLGMLVMTPMYLYRIGLQTLGHPSYTTFAGFLQLIARAATVYLLPLLLGEEAIYLTEVLAWGVSLPAVAIPFTHHLNRLSAKKE